LFADPLFVDMDGADNVLGYSTLGGGYNGGADDNFYLKKLSPAIDRGDAWNAPTTDIIGANRFDDIGTPNLGSPDYAESNLGSSLFTDMGTAQGWRSNGTYWTLAFPTGFSFPFYGDNYTSVYVSTEGYLYFTGSMGGGDGNNTSDKLHNNRIIAPLWDNLYTYGSGDDIFVDTATTGQVTVRWNATNEADGSDVNFAVTLFSDGKIRFDYGPGNTNLTPTVGISRGDGLFYVLSGYDGQASLTNANSIQFALTAGLTSTDIGAYEFRGNSNDTVPPQVTGTLPVAIDAAGAVTESITQIKVAFSEELNPIDAKAPANYELRRAVNGVFGDADDVVYTLSPVYTYDSGSGQSIATFNFGSVPLFTDTYRLTVRGDATRAIHDTAGLQLDGNRDGFEGPDYVRTFRIIVTRTWDGGGADNKWSTAANWVGDVAPTSGDNLVFPLGASKLESVNDYPQDMVFSSITVSGGNYKIQNNLIKSNSIEVQGNAVLTATSIICDTLTIGSSSGAASNTVFSNNTAPITAEPPQSAASYLLPSKAADNTTIASTAIHSPVIVEQPLTIKESSATALTTPLASVPLTVDTLPKACFAIPMMSQAISIPEILKITPLLDHAEQHNIEAILPQPSHPELVASAFYADNSSATRTIPVNPFLLTKRLKDSVYGELAEKQLPISNPSTHSHALQSLVNEYRYDSVLDQEDFLATHFRKQDKLAKKAVDEFHAELVGAIE
jgi:hypothetical protein